MRPGCHVQLQCSGGFFEGGGNSLSAGCSCMLTSFPSETLTVSSKHGISLAWLLLAAES